MRTINERFDGIEEDVSELQSDVNGLKHHSTELNGILKDKEILTNEQAARLNNHLDKN
jgi:uncharacterized protein YoxC